MRSWTGEVAPWTTNTLPSAVFPKLHYIWHTIGAVRPFPSAPLGLGYQVRSGLRALPAQCRLASQPTRKLIEQDTVLGIPRRLQTACQAGIDNAYDEIAGPAGEEYSHMRDTPTLTSTHNPSELTLPVRIVTINEALRAKPSSRVMAWCSSGYDSHDRSTSAARHDKTGGALGFLAAAGSRSSARLV